jgi:hypothetical protein
MGREKMISQKELDAFFGDVTDPERRMEKLARAAMNTSRPNRTRYAASEADDDECPTGR